MNEKITPLPFRLPLQYTKTAAFEIRDANYQPVCRLHYTDTTSNTDAKGAYIESAVNAYPALTARVKELEEALRWIPVSERLPQCGHWYLVCCPDNVDGTTGATMAFLDGIEGEENTEVWLPFEPSTLGCYACNEDDAGWSDSITHWMPLPEPPK